MAVNPHKLTRGQMEEILARGEGVIHNGVVITRPEFLPTAADLADGDPEAEAAVASDLQAKIDQLQADLARLTAEKGTGKGTGKGTDKGNKGVPPTTGGTTPPLTPLITPPATVTLVPPVDPNDKK